MFKDVVRLVVKTIMTWVIIIGAIAFVAGVVMGSCAASCVR